MKNSPIIRRKQMRILNCKADSFGQICTKIPFSFLILFFHNESWFWSLSSCFSSWILGPCFLKQKTLTVPKIAMITANANIEDSKSSSNDVYSSLATSVSRIVKFEGQDSMLGKFWLSWSTLLFRFFASYGNWKRAVDEILMTNQNHIYLLTLVRLNDFTSHKTYLVSIIFNGQCILNVSKEKRKDFLDTFMFLHIERMWGLVIINIHDPFWPEAETCFHFTTNW